MPGRGPRDSDEIKEEFARRLQAAMVQKGWNQSELARRATDLLPKPAKGQKRGKSIGRDSVSHYMRGRMLPEPAYLTAIAKALDMRPDELLPAGGFAVPPVTAVPFAMRGLSDGRVSININRTVKSETAHKIMAIIMEEDRAR